MRLWQHITKFVAVLVLLLGLPLSAPAQDSSPAPTPETSVVLVTALDENGQTLNQGTGFFIAPDQVVSSRQLFQGAKRAEVKTSDGKVYPVTGILAEDEWADLILLAVEGTTGTPSLNPEPLVPAKASKVTVLGTTGARQEKTVTATRYIAEFGLIATLEGETDAIYTGAPVLAGTSQIAGMITVQNLGGKKVGFVIPGSRIKSLKPGNLVDLSQWNAKLAANWINNGDSLFFEGMVSLWAGDTAQSQTLFAKALTLNPEHWLSWYYTGFAQEREDKSEDAITSYQQAIKVKPDFMEGYYALGWLYNDQKDYTKAVATFQDAISVNPEVAQAHANLAWTYNYKGQYTNATAAAKDALKLDPNLYDGHNALGYASFYLGRYKESAAECKWVLAVNPNQKITQYNLGVACFELYRYKEARDAFKEAIRLDPAFADAHFMLGLTYLKLHDRKSAYKEYDILQNLDRKLANQLNEWLKYN